jgi:hypothetical protein
MELCLSAGVEICRRCDVVSDIDHVKTWRIFQPAAPILGNLRINIFKLVHNFLARL